MHTLRNMCKSNGWYRDCNSLAPGRYNLVATQQSVQHSKVYSSGTPDRCGTSFSSLDAPCKALQGDRLRAAAPVWRKTALCCYHYRLAPVKQPVDGLYTTFPYVLSCNCSNLFKCLSCKFGFTLDPFTRVIISAVDMKTSQAFPRFAGSLLPLVANFHQWCHVPLHAVLVECSQQLLDVVRSAVAAAGRAVTK